MRQSDVLNWLLDEIEAYLASSSLVSLSDVSKHADVAEERQDHPYPFVAVRKISGTTDSAGIGNGDWHVDDVTYDTNDILQSITYRRDPTLRVDIVPLTDGSTALRDDLAEDLADHFSIKVRNGSLPADMKEVDVGEETPQGRTNDFVRSSGVSMEIDYRRFRIDDSVTAAETVNVDIDADGSDAFSETL